MIVICFQAKMIIIRIEHRMIIVCGTFDCASYMTLKHVIYFMVMIIISKTRRVGVKVPLAPLVNPPLNRVIWHSYYILALNWDKYKCDVIQCMTIGFQVISKH